MEAGYSRLSFKTGKRMKRSAFTMMELIFVIVIIAILAALAIPKLMGTRDDAKVATKMMKIGNIISEITSYATSQGKTDTNLTKMSNTVKELVANGKATDEENETKIKIDGVDCVDIKVIHTSTNDDLNVSLISSGASNSLCNYLQKEVASQLYQVHLRGNLVVQ